MDSTIQYQEYIAFELLIGNRTAIGYPVTVINSPGGDGNTICQLDPKNDLQDALNDLNEGRVDGALLNELGSFLFEELFTGDVLTLYRTSLGMARGENKRLRIRLRLEPSELAVLPWEYMYDAYERSFLATSSETALVRYVPMRIPVRPTTVKLPLRILAVISNPHNLSQLNVDHEKAILQEALAEWIIQKRVEIKFVEHASIANINQALRSFKPHVFHFIGHGHFEQNKALIMLEDEQENAHTIDENNFKEFFAASQETRLVVLNACQTATTSSTQPLVGIAPHLLERQLSAVVAMQYPIADRTALIFAREFYQSIALGYSIDAAVSEARRGIYQEVGAGLPDWGVPVLFLRAKDGQLFDLEKAKWQDTAEIRLVEPRRPPDVTGFVGREEELAYFSKKLKTEGLAIIMGMVGVGKTTFAAKVVRDFIQTEFILWHDCYPGEGVDAIIQEVAKFLAWYGDLDIWHLLNNSLHAGDRLISSNLLDYLFQSIHGKGYLLCLDNLQNISQDPMYTRFMDGLRRGVQAKAFHLILISQRMIDFGYGGGFMPLDGLSVAATEQLLAQQNIFLQEKLLNDLHDKTEGNAKLLTLTIQALQKETQPVHLIKRLIKADEVENFLLTEIDQRLGNDQRLVMQGVAVLLGYPGRADAIEEALDSANVRHTLAYLSNCYLVQEIEGESDPEYEQHSIIQTFYYELLGHRERIAMHRRAGEYYAHIEVDPFRAAAHFLRARDYKKAADLAVQDVRKQIYQGRALGMKSLLEEFTADHLEPELWVKIKLACGQIYSHLQESDLARFSFEEAVAYLEMLPDSLAIRILWAQVCRELGFQLRSQAPAEALTWLQRGLDKIKGAAPQHEADLQIQIGVVQRKLGNNPAALDALERALKLLPNIPSRLRLLALLNLGIFHYYCKDRLQSSSYMEQARAMADYLKDPFNSLAARANLASIKLVTGQWQAAFQYYREAVELAQKVGNTRELIPLLMNWGILYVQSGDIEQASINFSTSLDMARKAKRTESIALCLLHSADLKIVTSELTAAYSALVEATPLVIDNRLEYQRPFLNIVQARYYLAAGNFSQASTHAERAIDSAQRLSMQEEEGQALRALAQAQWKLGQNDKALAAFEQSLALLHDVPYEAARTQVAWGQFYLGEHANKQSNELLEKAYQAFTRLGAKRAVAEVEELLKTVA